MVPSNYSAAAARTGQERARRAALVPTPDMLTATSRTAAVRNSSSSSHHRRANRDDLLPRVVVKAIAN
ncbi:hypothetical protein SLS62_006278 [Diatrype stigma]|uniref:Uncharacterized protein n=1 Tax=Diatrype stigma TaxID=117547 RepID=A0AAN9UR18_9PEZI